MEMEYTIPPFNRTLLPTRCHPCLPNLEEEGNAWIVSHYCNPPSQSQQELVLSNDLPLFTSLCLPSVPDYTRLMTIFKFFVWIFSLDDIIDDLSSEIEANHALFVGQHFAKILGVMRGKEEMSRIPMADKMTWWVEMAHNMSERQQRRFCESLRMTMDAWIEQIHRHQDRGLPDLDLDAYIIHRRQASVVEIGLITLEYGLGIEIDDESLQHPLIHKLHQAANDHMAWSNDLFSFKSEFLKGGGRESIAAIISRQSRTTFQESVLRVHKMLQGRFEECANLINDIQNCDDLMKNASGLEKYVKGVGNFVSGHIYWCYKTSRYELHGPKSTNVPLNVRVPGNVASII